MAQVVWVVVTSTAASVAALAVPYPYPFLVASLAEVALDVSS